jgi:arylsulfatase A-like enzyme
MHLGVQLFRFWHFGLPGGDDPVRPTEVSVPPYYPDTPAVRADLARHYDNIRQMDAALGEVLARLEADGLADSTIVWFIADHGDGLPRAKRELFDSGLRVPLIVHWPERLRPPDVRPGSSDERLVSFVDLAPTLLALAGVETPRQLHGRGFLSPESVPREYVYAARDRIDDVHDRQRAVRDARFKYIRSGFPQQPGGHRLAFRDNLETMRELRALHAAGRLNQDQRRWFEPPGEERLFDTREDPHELRDRSGDPAYAAVLERMRGALDAWLARVGDWSDVPEDEMVARFRPDGAEPVTPPPQVRVENGLAFVQSGTPGASLGYRIDGGRWRLYTQPLPVPQGARIEAKAVRYGWAESETVRLVD